MRLWTWEFWGVGLCTTRCFGRIAEVVSVVLHQSANALAAYLCWQASREYMGHPRVSWVMREGDGAVFALTCISRGADPAGRGLRGRLRGGTVYVTARHGARGGFATGLRRPVAGMWESTGFACWCGRAFSTGGRPMQAALQISQLFA